MDELITVPVSISTYTACYVEGLWPSFYFQSPFWNCSLLDTLLQQLLLKWKRSKYWFIKFIFNILQTFSLRKNQECYQEAFLPTLRTLFYAPASSPLAEINPLNVAELFVDLSRVSATNSLNKKNEDHQVSNTNNFT